LETFEGGLRRLIFKYYMNEQNQIKNLLQKHWINESENDDIFTNSGRVRIKQLYNHLYWKDKEIYDDAEYCEIMNELSFLQKLYYKRKFITIN
jgi:hypothetical protein